MQSTKEEEDDKEENEQNKKQIQVDGRIKLANVSRDLIFLIFWPGLLRCYLHPVTKQWLDFVLGHVPSLLIS